MDAARRAGASVRADAWSASRCARSKCGPRKSVREVLSRAPAPPRDRQTQAMRVARQLLHATWRQPWGERVGGGPAGASRSAPRPRRARVGCLSQPAAPLCFAKTSVSMLLARFNTATVRPCRSARRAPTNRRVVAVKALFGGNKEVRPRSSGGGFHLASHPGVGVWAPRPCPPRHSGYQLSSSPVDLRTGTLAQ